MEVSVHEAKTHLSRLLDLIDSGEQIIIVRHGKPVAEIVAPRRKAGPALGAMRGEFKLQEGWDRPLSDDEADAFWDGKW